jgi:hypothetical protein
MCHTANAPPPNEVVGRGHDSHEIFLVKHPLYLSIRVAGTDFFGSLVSTFYVFPSMIHLLRVRASTMELAARGRVDP